MYKTKTVPGRMWTEIQQSGGVCFSARTSKTGTTGAALGSAGASVLAAPTALAPAPLVFPLLLLINTIPMMI